MNKNKAAQALGKLRYKKFAKGKSKEEISEHFSRIGKLGGRGKRKSHKADN